VNAATAAYVVAASAYAGFQWLVHLVVYRSYNLVPSTAFPAFEQAHMRRITPLAAVLFGMLLVATVALFAADRRAAGVAATLLFAALLGLTLFGAAPTHRRLVHGYDEQLLRRLLRIDAVRTVVATLQLALAAVLLVLSG
jgi:hypothetical protein